MAKKSCDRPACAEPVPVDEAATACSSEVFAFFAVSSSSISAFVRFLPFPFDFGVDVGSVVEVEVDLDEDAGYGIEGGDMSRIEAVRATAASHSNYQLPYCNPDPEWLTLSRRLFLFLC
jgi:hypothetical protein